MTIELVREKIARKLCVSIGDVWEDLAETEGGLLPSKEDYYIQADLILAIPELLIRDDDQGLPACTYGKVEAYDNTSKVRGQAIQALAQQEMLKEHWVKVKEKSNG